MYFCLNLELFRIWIFVEIIFLIILYVEIVCFFTLMALDQMSEGGPLKSRILDVIISVNEYIHCIAIDEVEKNCMVCQKRMSSSHKNRILEKNKTKFELNKLVAPQDE